MEKKKCPVCNELSEVDERFTGVVAYNLYDCPRCGPYMIEDIEESGLNRTLKHKSAAISHFIRKNYKLRWLPGMMHFHITHKIYENELSKAIQPTPAEQAENLILYLGNELLGTFNSHSDSIDLLNELEIKLCAIIGCKDVHGLYYIIQHLKDDLVDFIVTKVDMGNQPSVNTSSIGLTFEGWQKYEELKKDHSDSKQVFMAMKFGEVETDTLYKDFLKQAVNDTGLKLVRIDEIAKAGVIDNNMRLEIRKSCLLLSELTHGNNGAYFEAGFAEGMDIPVIYLCEKSVFDSKDNKIKPHFDTNHCTTIIWEKGKEEEAMKKLKATIRLSVPDKVKMEDGK